MRYSVWASDRLAEGLLRAVVEPADQALRDAEIDKNTIDTVLLTGGATRTPKFVKLISDFLDGKACEHAAVAEGAALHAAQLAGDIDGDDVLLDATPHSLGIETAGGVMSKLIPRGSTIPAKKSETFSTTADNQTSIEFTVYAGERSRCADNTLVWAARVSGLKPAPRGVSHVEVCFGLDASGILAITAVYNADDGRKNPITITY
ncbi:Hsp70 family protein [Nonomuraea typhae]|uniref:Hsp70 family protein n=1 Tax=Nonomuraea typhae TaxID=2603600 RepID=A0ABW7ZDC5_9ACTN